MTQKTTKTKIKTAETKDARPRIRQDLYLADMRCHVAQNRNRIAACDADIAEFRQLIASARKRIAHCRAGIKLEQEQKNIIRRRIGSAERDITTVLRNRT